MAPVLGVLLAIAALARAAALGRAGTNGTLSRRTCPPGAVPDTQDSAAVDIAYTICVQELECNSVVLMTMIDTCIQESNCNPLTCGDRDSFGMYQQQPIDGWGTMAQCIDPDHSTRAFLAVAIPTQQKNPGDPPHVIAQMVQQAVAGDLYRHDTQAAQIIAAAAKRTGIPPPSGTGPAPAPAPGGPSSTKSSGSSSTASPSPTHSSPPLIVPGDGANALPPTTVTLFGTQQPAGPAAAGLIDGCTMGYTPVTGDDCITVSIFFGIALSDFMAWNPSIDAACQHLLTTQPYCVSTSAGQGAGTAAAAPVTLVLPPGLGNTNTTTNGTAPAPGPPGKAPPGKGSGKAGKCFPSAGFKIPAGTPTADLEDWWCDEAEEYAFMGFSHAVNDCPSAGDLQSAFNDMATTYGARYVRLYAACDRPGFMDDVVDAAYEAGLGVIALAWFGFTGGDAWMTRLASIVATMQMNPKAQYVVRRLAVGSETIFDKDIPASQLAGSISSTAHTLADMGTEVTTSDFAFVWNQNPDLVSAAQHFESSTLPFFSTHATDGGSAWPDVQSDLKTFAKLDGSKKIILAENGWPSNTDVWKANAASAVASVASEQAYYDMLDAHCADFKAANAGWFAHVYDDAGLPGWGVTAGGKAKFPFSPQVAC